MAIFVLGEIKTTAAFFLSRDSQSPPNGGPLSGPVSALADDTSGRMTAGHLAAATVTLTSNPESPLAPFERHVPFAGVTFTTKRG